MSSDERRRLVIMADYLFAPGVGRAIPKDGLRLTYSRKSGRPKLVHHDGHLFSTIKPNGAMALTVYGASTLARSKRFQDCCVVVGNDEAASFVAQGKTVFCKFVTRAGKDIRPRSEVAVLDGKGRVIAVGTAVLPGRFMQQFKSGVAVKVREGSSR